MIKKENEKRGQMNLKDTRSREEKLSENKGVKQETRQLTMKSRNRSKSTGSNITWKKATKLKPIIGTRKARNKSQPEAI